MVESEAPHQEATPEATVSPQTETTVAEPQVPEEQKQAVVAIDSESSEEEKEDPATAAMWGKIDEILKEYYLSNFQKLACKKFIKDKVGNPENQTVKRCREWIFMKLNGKRLPDTYHPRQLGCPDLVPGLSLKAWWDRSEFQWIAQLESQAHIIREELISLRETTGF